MSDLKDDLISKIKTLKESIWENRITMSSIDKWLINFKGEILPSEDEEICALFLLSQFMYFGNREMREILKALYRDLYKYPIIAQIRKANHNTIDMNEISKKFKSELSETKFLGVGNPSESGTHLLYYFRQENRLPKTNFIHTHHIFKRDSGHKLMLRFPDVKRYVFIDDLCGSGSQAIEYSDDLVEDLKNLKNNTIVSYYALFATKKGLDRIRKNTKFDSVESIFELDETYECFNENTRYFVNSPSNINRNDAKSICNNYGQKLWKDCPLGYKDSQLLLGFYHNIPDNTLPIIWGERTLNNETWFPIFRRYPKIYN